MASTKLKSSVKSSTELQPKPVGLSLFTDASTDDIFTNLMIQKGKKSFQKARPNLKDAGRMKKLKGYCGMSSTSVHHIEEVFIDKIEEPKINTNNWKTRDWQNYLLRENSSRLGEGSTLFISRKKYNPWFPVCLSTQVSSFKFT